jgi:hypothetical protein
MTSKLTRRASQVAGRLKRLFADCGADGIAMYLGFKQTTFVEYRKSEHPALAGLDTRSTQIGLNTYAELTK